jgi:PAS domain S-box-containing protein
MVLSDYAKMNKDELLSILEEKDLAIKDLKDQIRSNSADHIVALDSLPYLIACVDHDLKYVYVNKAYAEWHGKNKGYFPGKVVKSIIAEEAFNVSRKNIEKALKGESITFENIAFDNLGNEKAVKVSYSPIKMENGKTGFITLIEDITRRKKTEAALKQSEFMLRKVIDLIPHSIFAKDRNGRFILANKTMAKNYGLSVKKLLGKTEHDVSRNRKEAAYFLKTDKSVLKTGRKKHLPKEKITDYKGKVRFIETTKIPFKIGSNNEIAVLGVALDITAKIKAEEALKDHQMNLQKMISRRTKELETKTADLQKSQQALTFLLEDVNESRRELVALNRNVERVNRELAAVNRELEAFAYSVSHDLRAPLRHIDGFVSLLMKSAKEKLSGKDLQYLETIHQSSRNMGKLIDDLLVFSRMGRIEMNASKIKMDTIIEDTISSMIQDIKDRKIEWNISKLGFYYVDPVLFKQVWTNLISNALKFTRNRRIAKITIGCQKGEENNTIFFIKDNGVGFKMKYLNKLFGVFQRLHKQEEFEGTGVGLANVKRIIKRHGGEIWAKAILNKGAEFYFSLPRK